MHRRTLGGLVAAGAVAATLAGTVFAAGAATADPLSTPSLDTLVGVGSGTMAHLFDQGTASQPKGDASGTFVHDYNATKPKFGVASWDAQDPVTGFENGTIITKAKSSSDTSCSLLRPLESDRGIFVLSQNQTDTNKDSAGQTVYCVDYVRSESPPNTTSFRFAFSVIARDGIAWSFPKVSGETNPQPASLTHAQLVAIYTCVDRNWDQVGGKNAPIGAVMPQSAPGTRSSWLTMLGIFSTTVEPCWENGTITVNGTASPIEGDTGLTGGNVQAFTKTNIIDGVSVPAADNIFPYSIGDHIAQGPATHGVGGHATSVWGHGNLVLGETANVAGTPEVPITTNSAGQPVINPTWSSQFLRILYGVTRNGCFSFNNVDSTNVCLPSSTPPAGGIAYPTYEVKGLAALFGANGWICKNATAQADIVSYGFTRLSTCGALTAGD